MPAAISEDWVLIFVSEHLFSPKISSVRKRVAFAMAKNLKRDLAPSLRRALDIHPPAGVLTDFMQPARSLRHVCRLWSELAQELLYENIWVNKKWSSLFRGLEQPIMRRCPKSNSHPTRVSALGAPLQRRGNPAPPLLSLKRLYWIESWCVLRAARSLEHISLSTRLPRSPHLRSLVVPQLSTQCVRALLRTDLSALTELTISPTHITWPHCPVLPALRTLALVEHPAPTRAAPVAPDETQPAPALVCVRMHTLFQRTNVGIFLRPAFSALERVVESRSNWSEWVLLRERGCRVDLASSVK
ncbi:hypothetical protein B0H13DRAFT_1985558 [Mycena leptocephala]|nr:hypothetical protein B0H13DRAFT_1985558 [Mycena leptocephala]